MPGTGFGARLGAATTAPFGAALTAWAYLWRITPVHRRELDGSPADDLPGRLPANASRDELQLPEDGAGPLLHRTYTGALKGAGRSPEELISWIGEDPNRVVPLALARFKKTRGEPWRLAVGDEFQIRILAPWDGPVRVIEVTPTSFRLATLEGHLEAGQIEWRAFEREGRLVFQIDSRARAGDRFSSVLHDVLPMAKEVQLHMWTSVIERVARKAGAKLDGGVDVETRRVDADAFAQGAG